MITRDPSVEASGGSLRRKLAQLQRSLAHSRREANEALADLERHVREAEDQRLLVREVDHRAKNSLQLAAAMLQLQAGRSGDPRVKDELEAATRRLYSLAAVHAALYQAGDGDQAPVRAWLEQICQSLSFNPAVTLTIEAPEADWPIATAAPVGLLTSEAVANALKHAFPGGRPGEIVVRVTPTGDGRWRLEVSDNGDGKPDELVEGLGFSLLRTFARQLHAEFAAVEGDGGCGLKIVAVFPVPEPGNFEPTVS